MSAAAPLFLFFDKTVAVGGVPTFLRMLRELAQSFSQTRGCKVVCLSYLDHKDDLRLYQRPIGQTSFIPCAGSRFRFLLEAFRAAWRLPDALIVVGYLDLAPIAWLLKKLSLIEGYVLILYGVEAWRRRSALERLGIAQASAIVALSRYTAAEFAKHNEVDPARIRVILPAASSEAIAQPGSPRVGAFHLLSVGRLSQRDRLKGFDSVLAAFKLLHDRRPDARLTIGGDGDDRPRLMQLAKSLGLDKQVRFPGKVSESELALLYQDCDAFILLSRKEGYGLVFLEAMRFGKPCVGADCGGIPEAIENEVDGLLVDPLDSQAQADCLLRLAQDPGLRARLGENARRKARTKHRFADLETAWHSLFSELRGMPSDIR